MNTDNSQLLTQLQDIHSVGNPGWWPPAAGWWVLALMLLVACVFLLRALSRKLALARRRGHWLRELDAMNRDFDLQQDPQAYLAALNRLFRAVALKAFPGTHCARLQGEEWVAFLASLMPEFALDRSLSALAHGPYEAAPEFDAAALRESARTWVKLYG